MVGFEASKPAPDERKDGRLRRSLPDRPRLIWDTIDGRRLLVEHDIKVDGIVGLR